VTDLRPAARNGSLGSTWLTLRTTRLDNFSSVAEIDSVADTILHGSFRVYTRVRGSAGACAGFSIYSDDDNEADIEILTDDVVDLAHATDHGTGAEASSNVTFDGSWQSWNLWRLDWQSGLDSTFWNGQLLKSQRVEVPTQPVIWFANLWSNGGEWSGNMSVGESAYTDIQYIQMAYNTSSDPKKTKCKKVCKV